MNDVDEGDSTSPEFLSTNDRPFHPTSEARRPVSIEWARHGVFHDNRASDEYEVLSVMALAFRVGKDLLEVTNGIGRKISGDVPRLIVVPDGEVHDATSLAARRKYSAVRSFSVLVCSSSTLTRASTSCACSGSVVSATVTFSSRRPFALSYQPT